MATRRDCRAARQVRVRDGRHPLRWRGGAGRCGRARESEWDDRGARAGEHRRRFRPAHDRRKDHQRAGRRAAEAASDGHRAGAAVFKRAGREWGPDHSPQLQGTHIAGTQVTSYQTLTGSLAALALLGCSNAPAAAPPPASDSLRLVPIVTSGLSSPVYLTAPPGDTARLFVVEQAGQIRVVQHGQLLAMPFLDITGRVLSGGEEGLLSVAFHPLYATNHYFYVDYTRRNAAGDTVYTMIERYSVSADSNVADSSTHTLILQITQPQPVSTYPNHKGGLVMFGPDGLVYIGMGDGGSGGDPQNRAQNPDSLLGKLLRIDVDHGDPYAIPAGNPFASSGGAKEIWALGLRNPWRLAFDATAGLLYIADVGQGAWEEVDVQPASQGGLNYGWRLMEGAHCYNPTNCSSAGLVLPAVGYDPPKRQ